MSASNATAPTGIATSDGSDAGTDSAATSAPTGTDSGSGSTSDGTGTPTTGNDPEACNALTVEPAHLRSFEQIGLAYKVLGPKVEVHGTLQQPLILNIKHTLDHMLNEAPHCWDVISDLGSVHKAANKLYLNEWEDGLFDSTCKTEIYNKLL